MYNYEADFTNLIHISKFVVNESKLKITIYFDGGKLVTQTYADSSEFDEKVAEFADKCVLIDNVYYNRDRISIVIPNGKKATFILLGNVIINHLYDDVSEVEDVIAEIEPYFLEIGGKWYQGNQLHVVRTNEAALTIIYDFLGMDVFEVVYDDIDAYNAALEKIASIGEGGGGPRKVSTPRFSPSAGAVLAGTEVTITCSTSGATIHYTTDGSTPTSSSTTYSGPITVSTTTTIKAIAVKADMPDSNVATAQYTIALPTCANPVFNPGAGEVFSGTEVEITCATDGATIHYTTDGSVPDADSPVYSTALEITEAVTIKAIAMKEGYNDSTVITAAYTIGIPTVANPVFAPVPGSATYGTEVTITCSTDGATIYYTDDGSTPSASSTEYTGAITLEATTTFKAIAIKEGWNNSAVITGAYTVTLPTVATPVFTPAAGSVDAGTEVTITCATEDAVIHYTDDGSTPDATSPVYDGSAIVISAAKTLKAIGVKAGHNNSAIATAEYTIKMWRFAGVYNMVDDGEGDVDPAYQITASNISTMISNLAWLEANVYNDDPAGSKLEANQKGLGTPTSEWRFLPSAQAVVGYQLVYAYPASLGELTTITNNGFNANDTFSHVTLTLDGIQYLVYWATDPSGRPSQATFLSFN